MSILECPRYSCEEPKGSFYSDDTIFLSPQACPQICGRGNGVHLIWSRIVLAKDHKYVDIGGQYDDENEAGGRGQQWAIAEVDIFVLRNREDFRADIAVILLRVVSLYFSYL